MNAIGEGLRLDDSGSRRDGLDGHCGDGNVGGFREEVIFVSV